MLGLMQDEQLTSANCDRAAAKENLREADVLSTKQGGSLPNEHAAKKGSVMSKANSERGILLNRREALFLSATAGIGLAAGRQAHASDSIKTAAHQEPGNCSTPRTAIAGTQYGKVRGFVDGGVFTFKGIPYGQNTGGENRWLPAKPPAPWKDEYPALIYGANCPQYLHDWTQIEQTFLQDWDDGYQSEDMLKLNVWTPSLTGNRPVMFYIHGGGFQFGSSYELPSHEGAQMARYHDVVQVSVNHRLNALGFLDVSDVGGPAYEGSVSVGMADLVVALKWVRENIANFGGDPNRVMIYGQSGGGSKVTTLMGMPSAADCCIEPLRNREVAEILRALSSQRNLPGESSKSSEPLLTTSPRCRKWNGARWILLQMLSQPRCIRRVC